MCVLEIKLQYTTHCMSYSLPYISIFDDAKLVIAWAVWIFATESFKQKANR